MLRTRILAAATAAVLMLGMSVGGAGAALASPPAPPAVPAGVTITYTNGTTCNEIGYTKPSSLDNINGGTGSEVFTWGTFSWSGSVASWVVNPGWTVDLCVKGGSVWPLAEIDLGTYVGSTYTHPQEISHLGYRAVPPVASASIVTIPRDCDTPTTWNFDTDTLVNATWGTPFVEGGLIKIVATATGGALFAGGSTTQTFTATYEEAGGENCAPLVATAAVTVDPRDCFVGTALVIETEESSNVTWGDPVIDEEAGTITIVATATNGALFDDGLEGVSDDRSTRTFTEDYEPAGGDDCVEPAIGVTADAAKITCDTDGWFRFGPGLGVSEEDAARLDWTVGPVAYAGDTATGVQHPVAEAVTITITVSLDDESEGDFALTDESDDGVVDPETGDITYTFIFTQPDDCELGSVVVPDVTAVDECIPDDELELDLVPAATAVASFTVTAAANVSYTYTINGGSPIAVVFPDGESTVTITVTPGDTVIVTAVAASGYSLPEGYEPWEKTFDESDACIDLPELANWEVSASGTNEVCTPAGSLTSGSITVVFPVGPVENPNPVRYFIAFGTPQQQELTSAVTAVVPGSYVVTAIPRVPTDSVGDGGQQVDIPVTVGAWTGDDCELDTLAFTGAGAVTNWLGVIAVLLTVAGMGFVLRRHRVEV